MAIKHSHIYTSSENCLFAVLPSIGFPAQNIIRFRPIISTIKRCISTIFKAPQHTYYNQTPLESWYL